MSIEVNYNGKKLPITNVSPWRSVTTIPSGGSKGELALHEKYGLAGCYQFAHIDDIEDIGDELIHEKIGYIGKSQDVVNRTYNARTPKGNHGVSRVIRQRNWDREEVYVRYIYCEDFTDLENYLHQQMNAKYGYNFYWNDASEGIDGKYSRAIDALDGLTFDELCDIIIHAKDTARSVGAQEVEKKLETL